MIRWPMWPGERSMRVEQDVRSSSNKRLPRIRDKGESDRSRRAELFSSRFVTRRFYTALPAASFGSRRRRRLLFEREHGSPVREGFDKVQIEQPLRGVITNRCFEYLENQCVLGIER